MKGARDGAQKPDDSLRLVEQDALPCMIETTDGSKAREQIPPGRRIEDCELFGLVRDIEFWSRDPCRIVPRVSSR